MIDLDVQDARKNWWMWSRTAQQDYQKNYYMYDNIEHFELEIWILFTRRLIFAVLVNIECSEYSAKILLEYKRITILYRRDSNKSSLSAIL